MANISKLNFEYVGGVKQTVNNPAGTVNQYITSNDLNHIANSLNRLSNDIITVNNEFR